MNQELLVEQMFQALITGDRPLSRQIINEAESAGLSPIDTTHEVYWPALEMICTLYRSDQLSTLAHNYSTRLLRLLVDQNQSRYETRAPRHRKILLFSGSGESDELAGQIVADVAEADGYEVFFAGGGIANDEILSEVGNHQPDILLMFASAPADAPNIRQLIDHIQSVAACPEMQIVVGGGVFSRAEGLAEEIGADLWANTPAEVLESLASDADQRATPDQRTVGRSRRAKKTAAA